MASLFQKARIAVLSNAHSLIDKVIDLNSVEAVKQYVRDLEESLNDLRESAAVAAGNVTTVKRDVDALSARRDELDRNIDFILTDADTTNDHLAEAMQVRLNAIDAELVSKREELTAAEQTASALADAASKLGAKHADMVSQLRQLKSLEQATKAKAKAADAMQSAGAAMSHGADASVDDVTARLHAEGDVQDARLGQALEGFEDGVDHDVALAQASADLAARKARLAAAAAASSPEPASVG